MPKFWSYAMENCGGIGADAHMAPGLWETPERAKEEAENVYNEKIFVNWQFSPSHFLPGHDLWIGFVYETKEDFEAQGTQSEVLIVYDLDVKD